jgi:hypothetical protein
VSSSLQIPSLHSPFSINYVLKISFLDSIRYSNQVFTICLNFTSPLFSSLTICDCTRNNNFHSSLHIGLRLPIWNEISFHTFTFTFPYLSLFVIEIKEFTSFSSLPAHDFLSQFVKKSPGFISNLLQLVVPRFEGEFLHGISRLHDLCLLRR